MLELIAISGKQYAGKDLLADCLIKTLREQGFRKYPIALAIKREFANIYGLTIQDIEANKALYRPGLIALGQRRRLQDENYWLKHLFSEPGPKVVSDMRLLHEYDFFKQKGAFLIRLEASPEVRAKRGTIVSETDATECELDGTTNWDALLTNESSIADFEKQVATLLEKIKTQLEASV